MEMQGSRQLAATQQQAWDALNNPDVLKECIPGCDSITATGENAYDVVTAIKIGPVGAKFKGAIQLSDIQAPNSYTLTFEGNGGPAGFGKGTSKVSLAPKDGGCELSYTVTASVGGKIAQVGQRLIDGVAKQMAEKFFARFDEELQRLHPAPAPAEDAPAATVPAPATQESSGGIPAWVWIVIAVIVIGGYFALR
ncbi:MAG: carbon monoxide dehydrogenase [Burkholderiales bacterium 66-5]|mgnify:CR=1 FL=1|uniref:CoxG family protein n=1 Tax=Comamonas badia TaxID=265291 RepID=UPI0003FAD94F|nr:carbon monoxide dehydrogenase subunit G [Comamonas badia]OJU92214.1 MAG: carbon monoxide dehydrogenase [Burkholderiales bacterium 66-5]